MAAYGKWKKTLTVAGLAARIHTVSNQHPRFRPITETVVKMTNRTGACYSVTRRKVLLG